MQASSVQSEITVISFEHKMVLAQMVSGQGRQHPAVTGCGRGTIQPRQNPLRRDRAEAGPGRPMLVDH